MHEEMLTTGRTASHRAGEVLAAEGAAPTRCTGGSRTHTDLRRCTTCSRGGPPGRVAHHRAGENWPVGRRQGGCDSGGVTSGQAKSRRWSLE